MSQLSLKYKIIIIAASLCLAIFLANSGDVMNGFLNLVLAGVIPGTTLTIPFWLMMAFYCALCSLVVTGYVDQSVRDLKSSSDQASN